MMPIHLPGLNLYLSLNDEEKEARIANILSEAITERTRAQSNREDTVHELPLTERMLEIVLKRIELSTMHAAAVALDISEQTLKNHSTQILSRMNARNFTHAVVLLWPRIKDQVIIRDPRGRIIPAPKPAHPMRRLTDG